MGMWMVLVLVDVSGYVDGVGGCQWVCGWCWWMSVGVWMVLGKLLSVFVTQRVSVGMWMVLVDVSGYVDGADECQWVWMVLMSVSGCVDGVGGCQWVCGWYW